MDSPQYIKHKFSQFLCKSFKPYYKWIVLNTNSGAYSEILLPGSFKPYYKWIVLNTNK